MPHLEKNLVRQLAAAYAQCFCATGVLSRIISTFEDTMKCKDTWSVCSTLSALFKQALGQRWLAIMKRDLQVCLGMCGNKLFTLISKLMFAAILITAKTSYLNSCVVQYIAMAIIASKLEWNTLLFCAICLGSVVQLQCTLEKFLPAEDNKNNMTPMPARNSNWNSIPA